MNRVPFAAALVAACAVSSIAFAQTATGSGQAKPGAGQAPAGAGQVQQGTVQPAQGTVQPAQGKAAPAPSVADQKLARLKPEDRARLEAQAKAAGLDLKALAAQDAASANKVLETKKAENDVLMRLVLERKKLSALDAEIAKMKKDDKNLKPRMEERERSKKIVLDLEAKLAATPKEKEAAQKLTAEQQKLLADQEKTIREAMEARNAAIDAIMKMMQQMQDAQNAVVKAGAGR
jgi:hypothetical protein